jgi:proteasome lid subunit RPN8/RPN11
VENIVSITARRSVWDTIRSAADAAAPGECCGLLIGRGGEIADAYPARNVAARPTVRYEVDPRDHFAAIRAARARGLTVVGAFHSHPRSAPHPSPTDEAEALPGFIYLIVGRTDEEPWIARAFVAVDGNFVEHPLVFEA